MNRASEDTFFGLRPAMTLVAQYLFNDGTAGLSRELPIGELALSSLDITQRAQQWGQAGAPRRAA